MGIKAAAIEQFELWLPGELEYSARKSGYYDKIHNRAARPPEDPRSMHGFFETEWEAFRSAREHGVMYVPHHGKSAQLQLAKLAAGFFDKIAAAWWFESASEAETHVYLPYAALTAEAIVADKPWEEMEFDLDLSALLHEPFRNTPFAGTIIEIMDAFGDIRTRYVAHVAEEAGSLAVLCYATFADESLTADQLVLPRSELANTH